MSENNATERWLRVPGFPAYEVSDQGRVRSYWKRTGSRHLLQMVIGDEPRMLKCSYIEQGQVTVALCGGTETGKGKGRQRGIGVAHLVLMTFVRPPNPGEVARHLHNPDPWCLRLDNLGWGTRRENTADIILHHGKHHLAKLYPDDVREVRRLRTEGMSRREVAKLKGVSIGTIRMIDIGKTHKDIDSPSQQEPPPHAPRRRQRRNPEAFTWPC